MLRPVPVITIDGPSGSGKGTISRRLAKELGWHFLDSGALYRLVALGSAQHGIDLNDLPRLVEYARQLEARFMPTDTAEEPEIHLEGAIVSQELRTETCGNRASRVAAIQGVRDALLERQRGFAQPPGLVADGRDMGTTVFPAAKVKIYLTASVQERAQRRYNQLKAKGFNGSLAALVEEITERDARDSQRQASPLVAAADAVSIDTSAQDIEAVMATVRSICQQRLADNFQRV